MPQAVKTTLTYIVDTGVRPVNFVARDSSGVQDRIGEYEPHETMVHDARADPTVPALDREGFELRPMTTKVRDFYDPEEVKAVYHPELEALVKEATGATEAVVFDTTLRVQDESLRTEKKVGRPVMRVHNDYTAWSAPKRVRELMPADRVDDLLSRRFAIINVWRSIKGPVESMPLAICDARSIAAKDLIATERRAVDRVGEIQHLAYNPEQRWYYFPHLAPDEAILLKCYDSATDGTSRYTAHSAFVDPTTPPGAPDRESIEARLFVFY